MVHALKWLSMSFHVLYVMLGVAALAVSVSWFLDEVDTGIIRLNYGYFLAGLIGLGTVLMVVGFVGCIGSLNDSFYMTSGSAMIVLLLAIGFATIAGVLSTNFHKAEATLRVDMEREISMYSTETNKTAMFWDRIQSSYNCCGINTPNDWITRNRVIPDSCLPDVSGRVSYLPGCFDTTIVPARKAVEAGVCTTALMAGVLAIGFICNVISCAVLKRTREKEI